MSDCKIHPADTVDIYGNAWPTVGENIRNGLFGKNVKVGYVNINKGKVTSTDFIVATVGDNDATLVKINCLLVFTESLKQGGVNISFTNSIISSTLHNTEPFSTVNVTLKIIYKEVV